ncbi:MAG: hypothetical protein GEU93_03215 [Propionibacteriales bacterium]|nr:hypothetical protein [Propionibacteriales bacterium]
MSEEDLRAEVPAVDERSRRALESAQEWVGDGVQGVAIGATESGEPCVVVYVLEPEAPAVQRLPDECEGLPVRVERGDAFTAGG